MHTAARWVAAIWLAVPAFAQQTQESAPTDPADQKSAQPAAAGELRGAWQRLRENHPAAAAALRKRADRDRDVDRKRLRESVAFQAIRRERTLDRGCVAVADGARCLREF